MTKTYVEKLLEDLAKEDPIEAEGLSAKQQRFLRYRTHTLTDDDAMHMAGVTLVELFRWRSNTAFLDAYTLLNPVTDKAVAKVRSKGLLNKALDTIEHALEGQEVSKEARWAAEHVLKMEGMEVVRVEQTTTNMPADAKIALAMLEHNVPLAELPPGLRELVLRWFPQHPAVRGQTSISPPAD